MTALDRLIVIAYLSVTVLVGLWATKTAARSTEDYFLAGRSLPWWLLGVSGMATFIDMGATASVSGWFYLIGIKGYWLMFNGHLALSLSFQMIYAGKWVRRSGCVTNAEWMITHFGTGRAGNAARSVTAVSAILVGLCFMPFFWIGAGKTLVGFFPFFEGNVDLAAGCFFGLIALYTVCSGFYGVVYTDFFQAFLVLALILFFAIKAFGVGTPEYFAQNAPAGWFDLAPGGEPAMPRDYSAVVAVSSLLDKVPLLLPLLLFWVANNLLHGFAFSVEAWSSQRYYAARDTREASLVAALWIGLTSLRYLLLPAIAVLALPLAARIADPEQALPVVMRETLGSGLFGLMVAGLLAAGMSTVSTIVNACAAYYVRDIHHAYVRPQASERDLTRVAYLTSLLILIVGGAFGMTLTNIDSIWGWIMMSVFVGTLPPNIVKWFWWRANGWSIAAGCLAGLGAGVSTSLLPDYGGYSEIVSFLLVFAVSTLATFAATLLTPPTEMETLTSFYRRTRPFGFWDPVRANVEPEVVATARGENRRDLRLLPAAVLWHFSLFSVWGCLILKQWHLVVVLAMTIVVSSVILYFGWFKNLR